MRIYHQKITIVRVRKPKKGDLNEELKYFGDSLGLFGLRDKDKSLFRMFIEMIKGAKNDKSYTSDQLAEKLALSRGTVVHHLNKLMQSGIVVSDGNKYLLRVDNLGVLVDELKKDLDRTLSDLKEMALEIDKALGL